ncbi:hypothetical protein BC938DRAFT_473339 [Jimgerdemannia flammicorona]|uniref:Uncharacterized protein n=1 Tax=Jimgerdemannia flammicorona TaxID=994334 RepID=A0A433QTG6_9FUNG|nr:hypothetical protein BC938DRAFT_473339 [Jimgerdemannia flammicorona]
MSDQMRRRNVPLAHEYHGEAVFGWLLARADGGDALLQLFCNSIDADGRASKELGGCWRRLWERILDKVSGHGDVVCGDGRVSLALIALGGFFGVGSLALTMVVADGRVAHDRRWCGQEVGK